MAGKAGKAEVLEKTMTSKVSDLFTKGKTTLSFDSLKGKATAYQGEASEWMTKKKTNIAEKIGNFRGKSTASEGDATAGLEGKSGVAATSSLEGKAAGDVTTAGEGGVCVGGYCLLKPEQKDKLLKKLWIK